MTRAQEPKLSETKADVMRYPKDPTAYSLVGRWTALMSGRKKCIAAMTTTKYAVPKIATMAKIAKCFCAFGLEVISACIGAPSSWAYSSA
jgi:hypothetical protein